MSAQLKFGIPKGSLLHATLAVVKHYFVKSLFTGSEQDFILIEILIRNQLIERGYP